MTNLISSSLSELECVPESELVFEEEFRCLGILGVFFVRWVKFAW